MSLNNFPTESTAQVIVKSESLPLFFLLQNSDLVGILFFFLPFFFFKSTVTLIFLGNVCSWFCCFLESLLLGKK